MSKYTSKHTGPKIDEAVDRANGYGLGAKTGKLITDGNDALVGGWFYWGNIDTNLPFTYGHMRVDPRLSSTNGQILMQTAYSDGYPGCVAQRKLVDGVWKPWEWVNPPMKLGVEYRTTERYLEKPVYALCANFGANIDGSSMYFGENVLRIVRGQAYSGQGDGLYPWYQGKTINNWTAFFDFTVGTDTSDNIRKIKVTCRANSSASNTYSTTYVVLYYTKSTD